MYMYVCACMYGFIYLCVCLYVLLIPSLCTYIYIYRDSEREKTRDQHVHLHKGGILGVFGEYMDALSGVQRAEGSGFWPNVQRQEVTMPHN